MKRLIIASIIALCAYSSMAQYPEYIRWDTNSTVLYPTNFLEFLDERYASSTSTNGESGTPSTNEQGIVTTPGEVTLRVYYGNDQRWCGADGTLYVYAWDNWQMQGYPVYESTYAISGGVDGLQNFEDQSITVTEGMVSQTWWYAFADMDEDGALNCMFTNYSGTTAYFPDGFTGVGTKQGSVIKTHTKLEPAALGEFAPLILDSVEDEGYVVFALVDRKGATPRFGWHNPVGWHESVWKLIDIDEGQTELTIGPIQHRSFVCEQDYINSNIVNYVWYYGATPQHESVGGLVDYRYKAAAYNGFLYISNSTTYATWRQQAFSDTTETEGTAFGSSWDYEVMITTDYGVLDGYDLDMTPVATHPINGATVAVQEVELIWTNSTPMFSAVSIEINEGFTNGVSVYDVDTYLENHHPDGTVRHLARALSDANFVMTTGSNYFWRVRPILGADKSPPYAWTNRVWSEWAEFEYEAP